MGRAGEGGECWTLAGAAFVMPIAGLNGKHVWAPDYPGTGKKARHRRSLPLSRFAA